MIWSLIYNNQFILSKTVVRHGMNAPVQCLPLLGHGEADTSAYTTVTDKMFMMLSTRILGIT